MKIPPPLALASIALCLAACSKPANAPGDSTSPTPTPGTSMIFSTPSAAKSTSLALAAATPGRNFYLTERVSHTTTDGISSFPPGTKVILISKTDAGIKVHTADGTILTLKPSQITESSTIGAQFTQADEAARQLGAQQRAQEAAAILAAQAPKPGAALSLTIPAPKATPAQPFPFTEANDLDSPYDKKNQIGTKKKPKGH